MVEKLSIRAKNNTLSICDLSAENTRTISDSAKQISRKYFIGIHSPYPTKQCNVLRKAIQGKIYIKVESVFDKRRKRKRWCWSPCYVRSIKNISSRKTYENYIKSIAEYL